MRSLRFVLQGTTSSVSGPMRADKVGGNANSGREILFGRKTYQMMEAFWPMPIAAHQMPNVAKGMNAVSQDSSVASRLCVSIFRLRILLN
jgi:hypothetical protein